MSHFVVMVTNTDIDNLESQLEPFDEQGEENDYFMKKEYFVERNQKSVDDWLEEHIASDKEFLESVEKGERSDINPDSLKYRKKSLKELERIKTLKTLTGKINAIHRYEGGGIDKNGLYWVANPEAKWDWWVEGGRWDGWLVKKDGTKCNRCKVRELSFEKMRKADMEDRAKWYDEEMERAKEFGREPVFWNYEETPTKEQYVNDTPIYTAPFAVLHEGEWIEKGNMGWFGMSDDKYSDDEWGKKFQEFFKTLDPESEITIVDCHI